MFPLKDQKQFSGMAWITFVLVLVNAYVFYLELTTVDLVGFVGKYALIPENLNIADIGSLFTFVSSLFLHGGWFHLVTNMWFLIIFGPNMERAWGSAKFLAYYFLSGFVAAFLQLIFTTDPSVPMLGASGAIAGVLGAYFVYFPHHRITTLVPLGFIPLFIAIPAGIVLLYWFGLQVIAGLYVSALASEGVAFFAHIGGFIAGVILAISTRPGPDIVRSTRYL